MTLCCENECLRKPVPAQLNTGILQLQNPVAIASNGKRFAHEGLSYDF